MRQSNMQPQAGQGRWGPAAASGSPAGVTRVPGFGSAPIQSGPPVFQRIPREYILPPRGEFEISAPPTIAEPTSTSLVALLMTGLLPALGMVGGLAISALAFSGGGIWLAIPMAFVSLLSGAYGIYSFRHERRKHKGEVAKRGQVYHRYLAERRNQLQALHEEQQRASLLTDPSLDRCRARALGRDRRLWERSPRDEDFLDLRLGIGPAPTSFSIKPPSSPQVAMEEDALLQEGQALAAEFQVVRDVAIRLPLGKVGAAGLVGPRDALQSTTRALLMQLATHHAPSEVKLVLIFPESEQQEWVWVRWLPHTWSDDRTRRFVATSKTAHGLLNELNDMLKRRQLHHQAMLDSSLRVTTPAYLFVFADPTMLSGTERVRLDPLVQMLVTQGPALGAYSLFLTDRPDVVQKECGAVVDLTRGAKRLRLIGPPQSEMVFEPDWADAPTAEQFACALAPLRLQGGNAASKLPTVISLFDLFNDVNEVEDLPVLDMWEQSEPFRSLGAAIGLRARDEVLVLDLHQKRDGPHGLVAGTVGSGKSELLLTLITSLAARFHPHEVVFALLDFKGGGMADAVENLPHVVSKITDLELEFVPRAITSLKAEIERRKRLFKDATEKVGQRVDDLDDYMRLYRKGQVSETLPYLILVVDEFTVLKNERPEDMETFMAVSIQGRSLGFRMILATQKPAGVVSEQIDANTRFRLCLRVARPEDSQEMIGRADAAFLSGAGRCYLRVGQDEKFELFQSAWSGAPYAPVSSTPGEQRVIKEVALDGTRKLLSHGPTSSEQADTGKTQLHVLVSYLQEVADRAGIEKLEGAWLPLLPRTVGLDAVRVERTGGWDGKKWQPSASWLEPAVGLVDNPARQSQRPLSIPLGREGHLAVFGGPGSGKTTLLQTLVTSIVLDHSPEEVNLYLVDFGGRLLKLFEMLPHVGAVILPSEAERLGRLISMLLAEMEIRKEFLASAGAGTLASYREYVSDAPPAIVVVVDNYAEFANAYDELADSVNRIAAEGGNLGIHLVLASTTLPYRLAPHIALAVALELTDPSGYSDFVGRTGGLVPAPGVPGRGLVRGTPPLEFQTALPAEGESSMERTNAIKELVVDMSLASPMMVRARPIMVLSNLVPLSTLLAVGETSTVPSSQGTSVPLAIDAESLQSLEIDLSGGPHFIITGPTSSGKSTLLQTWLLGLAARFTPEQVRLYMVSMGNPSLRVFSDLPHAAAYVEADADLATALGEIAQQLEERRATLVELRRVLGGIVPEQERQLLAGYPRLVLAADDFDEFRSTLSYENREKLEVLIKRGKGLGLHVIVAGPAAEFTSAFDTIATALKEGQTGFLLGSTDYNDLGIFNLRVPPGQAGKTLPPGRGFFARRSQHKMVQVASCHAGTPTLGEWLEQIKRR